MTAACKRQIINDGSSSIWNQTDSQNRARFQKRSSSTCLTVPCKRAVRNIGWERVSRGKVQPCDGKVLFKHERKSVSFGMRIQPRNDKKAGTHISICTFPAFWDLAEAPSLRVSVRLFFAFFEAGGTVSPSPSLILPVRGLLARPSSSTSSKVQRKQFWFVTVRAELLKTRPTETKVPSD